MGAAGMLLAVVLSGIVVFVAVVSRDDEEDPAQGQVASNTAGSGAAMSTAPSVTAVAATAPSVTAVAATAPSVTAVAATAAPAGAPLPVGQPPANLGGDVTLDALASACYDGDMGACDELFLSAPSGSGYRRYGDTCAGRQPERTGLLCVTTFGDRPATTA